MIVVDDMRAIVGGSWLRSSCFVDAFSDVEL